MIILRNLIYLYIYIGIYLIEFYLLLYFLVFRVCEAVLGLRLLSLVIRVNFGANVLIKNLSW